MTDRLRTGLERIGLPLLSRIDPETAHTLALYAVRSGLVALPGPITSPALRTSLAGLDLPNPLGLAAGFDKNATAVSPLLRAGFGFIEVGGVTPRPQPGNPRPRLFRLREDQAIINRFGFNNDGMDVVARRLAQPRPPGIVGINLGANKDSSDRSDDYARVLRHTGAHVNFATINVSSPNTESLRDLQGRDALAALIDRVLDVRAGLPTPIPIFVKIAPDLDESGLADLVEVCMTLGVEGIIATNTTLARNGLRSRHAAQAGGLSGRPLLEPSTWILRRVHDLTGGTLPLIGVGGIDGPETAAQKLAAGATAIQLYSALVYRGLRLVPRILRGLDSP